MDALDTLDPLFAALARSDAPGGVVGVALGGRTVYRSGFGLASVQHGVANVASTRMRIGSTTKHFTCLAALLLAEDGLLDLDVPATRWLPELPALRGVPTLRQFMQHTSGYRCGLAMSLVGNGLALQPPGWDFMALTRQRDANFAPGDDWAYCNGGYHLLSIAIERVSGMSLAAFMKSRLFKPLALHDTDLIPSDHGCVPGLAAPHLPAPDGAWRRGFLPSEAVLGEGGIVSTVDDMLRWLAHLRGPHRVGSNESWRQMFAPARLNNGFVSSYSLGLRRQVYRGVEIVHHSGAVFGGNSQMLTVPERGLDIAIMLNGAPVNASALALQIVDALLPEHLGPPATPVQAAPYPHLLGVCYQGDGGRLLRFEALDAKLAFGLQHAAPTAALIDGGGGRFTMDPVSIHEMSIEAAGLADAAPDTLTLHRSGRTERLQRLRPPALLPARTERTALLAAGANAPLLGHYRSHDLGADAEIACEGQALVLRLRGEFSAWRTLMLEPLSETVFGAAQAGVPFGRTVLTLDGSAQCAVAGFHLDDARAWRLRFVRV